MRVRRALLRGFALPLVRPLPTAHGGVGTRLGWLVELEGEDGVCGFGEATPLPSFGTETPAACLRALSRECDRLVSGRGLPLGASAGARTQTPCAQAAIETARFDLEARARGFSLAKRLAQEVPDGIRPADRVASQALISGVAPAEVEENAQAAIAAGFEAFKLKLAVTWGAPDLALDLDRVAALRAAVGSRATIRLDANEAWEANEAERALVALSRFDVDFVEQPVRRDDLAGLTRLTRAGAIPVAADEALQGDGLSAFLGARAATILVVKPAALGGLVASVRLAGRAREEGWRLIWSTLLDGAVGRGAVFALAAAFGATGEVHGLGTANLLADDLGHECATVSSGWLRAWDRPGLGFRPEVPAGRSVDAALRFEFVQ